MAVTRKNSLLLITLALSFPTLITWLYFVALRGTAANVQQAAYVLGKVIQFGLPVAWVFGVRRERLSGMRPPVRGIGLGLGFGLVIGVAMGLLYGLVLKPAGFFDGPGRQVVAKVMGMGLDTPLRYLAVGVFYAIGHSLLEEYYWRWFVFRELRSLVSVPSAIAVSSLGFMAHHILVLATYFGWTSPATWLFSVCVAVGGAVWAWLYQRSQSLLGPWASHCLVDAAIFLVGFDLVRHALH